MHFRSTVFGVDTEAWSLRLSGQTDGHYAFFKDKDDSVEADRLLTTMAGWENNNKLATWVRSRGERYPHVFLGDPETLLPHVDPRIVEVYVKVGGFLHADDFRKIEDVLLEDEPEDEE